VVGEGVYADRSTLVSASRTRAIRNAAGDVDQVGQRHHGLSGLSVARGVAPLTWAGPAAVAVDGSVAPARTSHPCCWGRSTTLGRTRLFHPPRRRYPGGRTPVTPRRRRTAETAPWSSSASPATRRPSCFRRGHAPLAAASDRGNRRARPPRTCS